METFFISLLHKEYTTKFNNLNDSIENFKINIGYADEKVKELSNLLYKKYKIVKEIKKIKKPSSVGDFSTEQKSSEQQKENPLTNYYKELENIEQKISIVSKEINYFFEVTDKLSSLISQTNSSIQSSVSRIYESWIDILKTYEE